MYLLALYGTNYIEARIRFSIALNVFKAQLEKSPFCLTELLTYYNQRRCLKNTSQNLLVVPKYRLKTCGSRSFSYAGPIVWIPVDIKSETSISKFEKLLKFITSKYVIKL